MNSTVLALIVFLILSFGAATVGTLFSDESVRGWYGELKKPSWTPPSWVFGPVWTILYIAIAFSGWFLWRQRIAPGYNLLMTLFVLQLVLNTLWSVIFFYYRRPGWAFLELVILWAAIGVYTLGAWSVSRISFILFLPYWAWVTFAGVLNYSIWRMNLDK